MSSNKLELPQRDARDELRDLIKVGLALFPVSAVAELFDRLAPSIYEKRLREFQESLAQEVILCQEKVEGFNFENLLNSESATTTLMTALREAAFTHQEETLTALRNAVLNATFPEAPDDNKQKMFVQWAVQLTPWHLRILNLFAQPGFETPGLNLDGKWRENMELQHLSDAIEAQYPEMKGYFHFYVQIIHDLHQRGFLINQIPERKKTSIIPRGCSLAPIAREFLKFIKSPIEATTLKQ